MRYYSRFRIGVALILTVILPLVGEMPSLANQRLSPPKASPKSTLSKPKLANPTKEPKRVVTPTAPQPSPTTVRPEANLPVLIIDFSADKCPLVTPAPVRSKNQFVLRYEVRNARSVRIDPEPGKVKAVDKGSVMVTPQTSTTYTLTATGSGGKTATRQIAVQVPSSSSTPTASLATRTVVRITAIEHIVEIRRDGTFLQAKIGDTLSLGDIVRTRKRSKCEIQTAGGGVMRMGQLSALRVESGKIRMLGGGLVVVKPDRSIKIISSSHPVEFPA